MTFLIQITEVEKKYVAIFWDFINFDQQNDI